MSDLDPIRSLFSGAKAELSGLVKPPGAAVAEQAGRRRRLRRRGTVAALSAFIAAAVIVVPIRLVGPPPTPIGPSPSVSPSILGPTATPTDPSPSVTSSTEPSAVAGAQASATAKPGCVKRGYVHLDPGSGTATFNGNEPGQLYYRICPGEKIKVWHVTYLWGPDGYARLQHNEVAYVTYEKPKVTMNNAPYESCQAMEAWGTGTISFPAFPPGTTPRLRDWSNGRGAIAATFNGETAPSGCLAAPSP